MVTQDLNAQNVNAIPMGERLVVAGLLSDRDLERARLAKREMGCMLGEALVRLGRSEERRVGKEGSSRWSPGHLKKNIHSPRPSARRRQSIPGPVPTTPAGIPWRQGSTGCAG